MVNELSEASLHELKGSLNYVELSENKENNKRINMYLQHVLQTIIYTLYHENVIWKYLFKTTPNAPPPFLIERWSPKTKICTQQVLSDGQSVSSKIS